MTYFFKYVFDVSSDYIIAYQNLEYIEKEARKKGFVVTETELNYMKRIMISYDGAFSYSDFLKMAKVEMSKQGALKTLNKLVDCGFLVESESKSKTKLFDICKENIPFKLKNFGYRTN